MTENDQGKRVFLIATESNDLNLRLETFIKSAYPSATVFKAIDGSEALFKCENVPPQIAILESRLPKVSGFDLGAKLLNRKERVAIVFLAPTDVNEVFMDEIVTGQVQFLSGSQIDDVFLSYLHRATSWLNNTSQSMFQVRHLQKGERLITEGQPGDYVYLVRHGELKAFKNSTGNEVLLGLVKPGEFVGEMAYINGEARSANVETLTECELIEFRAETLDAVLFSKPAWAKALMKTLSKRLKVSNEIKS